MYCKNCGAELDDGVKRCSNCGAVCGGSVTLCSDGKYRWVYEMNLFKNPAIWFLIWKIVFFIIFGMFAFLVLIQSGSSRFWWDGFLDTAKVFGLVFLGMTVLSALGYLLYAAIMGGKYIVEFEMDEKGINHKQTVSQQEKAKKLSQATMIAGAASGRSGMVGAGMNAERTEMYTAFTKVKKVKAYPHRSLIKVNETLGHNQVYAAKEDFAFVKDYIVSHCPNIKKK